MLGDVSLVSVWSGLAKRFAAAPEAVPLARAGRWPRILPFVALSFWERAMLANGFAVYGPVAQLVRAHA